jgi:multicomponent Na+:H+ antiporter subunit F
VSVVDAALLVAAISLVISGGLTFSRLVRGPGMLDRVVALDVLAALVVALTVVAAIRTGESALIDVGLTIALVSFVGTIAVAHFVEERGRDR